MKISKTTSQIIAAAILAAETGKIDTAHSMLRARVDTLIAEQDARRDAWRAIRMNSTPQQTAAWVTGRKRNMNDRTHCEHTIRMLSGYRLAALNRVAA